jgi:hypothetical protein
MGTPMKIGVIAAGLCLTTAAAVQAGSSAADQPLVLAQGGFTFGSRDDLGPRYDPYSERWGRPKPPDTVCRWVQRRAQLPDGRVVTRRERECGFRVPARE